MARIVNELNLNKTPQLVKNNSLIFAKNIKLFKDGSIGADSAIKYVIHYDDIIGHIVGINSKVYLFVQNHIEEEGVEKPVYNIVEYDELSEMVRTIPCSWKYSGGTIDGCVTINSINEPILTICEKPSKNSKDLIPIKHINLNTCSYNDDESIYTQTPIIPITNLLLTDKYIRTIPNGVYQFFVRYKVRNEFYTNWFPCSKECFAGTQKVTNTIQGGIIHVNTEIDAKESFVFTVEHLFDNAAKNFEEYQLGFIISNEDSSVARTWKSFDFSVNTIYFDYDQVAETNIDDLLNVNYELFNVGNVTYFRNKLYIADYKETDFNPDFQKIASNIDIDINSKYIKTDSDVYISGKALTKSSPSLPYFDKWGDDNINVLFKSSFNDVYHFTSQKEMRVDSSSEFGAATIKANWSSTYNPDLYWVNYAKSNAKNLPNPFPEFEKGNNWWDTGYLTLYNLEGFIDTNTHPLTKYNSFRRRWYWASGSKNNNVLIGNGYEGVFPIYDNGFGTTLPDLTNAFKEKVESLLVEVCGICKLRSITCTYAGKKYYVMGNENIDVAADETLDFSGIDWFDDAEHMISKLQSYVVDKIVGLDEQGKYVLNIDGHIITVDRFEVNYSTYDYDVKVTTNNTDGYTATFKADTKKTNKVLAYNIKIDNKYITDSNNDIESVSLLPFTDYEFYVHFVKENGVTTNGYYIDTKSIKYYNKLQNPVIFYPSFTNIVIPEGYVSCFISINPVGDIILQGFNHEVKDGYHYLDCLESDAGLKPLSSGLTIVNSAGEVITKNAEYHSSSSTNPISMFGNSGCIKWEARDDEPKVYQRTFAQKNIVFDRTEQYVKVMVICNTNTIDLSSDPKTFVYDTAPNSKPLEELLQEAEYFANTVRGESPAIQIITSDAGLKIHIQVSSDGGNVGLIGIVMTTNPDESEASLKLKALSNSIIGSEEIIPDNVNHYWVKIKNDTRSNKNKRLIKITPYLKGTGIINYFNVDNLNLPGYMCKVSKINRNVANNLYYSGTDIYIKGTDYPDAIELNDFEEYASLDGPTISYVLSSYNLNYLSSSDDLVPQLRSYKTNNETVTLRQIAIGIQSSTSSYNMELKSMYRDYVRKYYNPYDKEATIDTFKNTIRSSSVNRDESHKSIYIFDANEYYNIPTNRGSITNMFNILDNIYIHTEHSLFKFSGKNSLSSEDSEIMLKEGNIFDTGISEVFDSKYGYAGLQNKNHSVITFNSYIFYDKLANTIYAYSGNNQLATVSDSIKKILDTYKINDVYFVADEYNDRFFANFKLSDNSNICLSYNVKSTSFVSIHDLDFSNGFNSRLNTYFIRRTEDRGSLYLIDKTAINDYNSLFTPSALKINDMSTTELESAIDIIFNTEYEKVKCLNHINWICSEIKNYETYINEAEEELDRMYSGSKLKIYTDICSTPLVDLVDSQDKPLVANDTDIRNPNNYKYPRYNCGIWSFNYFRDVNTQADIFKYAINSIADKALVYGKYFVVRFIFKNKNFKIENIIFNINNYEKV